MGCRTGEAGEGLRPECKDKVRFNLFEQATRNTHLAELSHNIENILSGRASCPRLIPCPDVCHQVVVVDVFQHGQLSAQIFIQIFLLSSLLLDSHYVTKISSYMYCRKGTFADDFTAEYAYGKYRQISSLQKR